MAPKITKELSFVDFSHQTASQVFNLFRALNYDDPLRCLWGDKTVFLRSLTPIEEKGAKGRVSSQFLSAAAKYEPGTVLYCKKNKKLVIRCKDDWVYCDSLQIMPKSKATQPCVIGNMFAKEDQRFTQFQGY